MKRIFVGIALLAMIVGCNKSGGSGSSSDGSSKTASDAERIQGDWVIEAAFERGEAVPEKELGPMKGAKVVITATTITFKNPEAGGPGKDHESKYTLDSSKDPKEIDVMELPDKGSPGSGAGEEKLKGVYVLEGDTLKIHMPRGPQDDRPKEMTTKKDGRSSILVMKRAS